ncbi:DUF2971 domain-containing protein [Vibrio rhizosphaerae]|uniref:DUF2971 domain-containing protein n=1 Tax=Vibrio rhizosphaerae TaxID=398736 RepID=A0ABU4IYD2_9VIBR|nr:DUF2971 domain-containing protein [Vibrio rhizosphaerae]MDW6094411.1 DUF2971 domain-containing protein [Vibrio rhizosphaerae]
MTIDRLYRFRPVDNLLDKYNELEKQSIYFSRPEDLNDPVEGFRDIYWQGDSVVWENLFNHYLLCLMVFSIDYIIINETEKIDNPISPTLTLEDLHENFQNEFKIISDKFLNSEYVKNITKNISKYRDKVSDVELSFYLRNIHLFAINSIFEHLEKIGAYKKNPFNGFNIDSLKTIDENFFSTINELTEKYGEEKMRNFLKLNSDFFSGISLIQSFNDRNKNPNKHFLISHFPHEYTRKLEELMYPEWLTACFMSDSTNSSVWGSYGVNHTGVCLVFSPEEKNDGNYITLDGVINGASGKKINGEVIIKINKGKQSFKFHEINYKPIMKPINFFESIAQLPYGKVYKTWFIDRQGNKSKIIPDYNDMWRDNHWENFYQGITQKTKDWEYENEHRLIITTMGNDYNTIEDRTLTYNFKSLKGIIFGIKTSEEDKVKIMGIVETKIKENEHYDFSFYQAYYCHDTGKIKHYKLSALKFKKPTPDTDLETKPND